MQIMKCVRLSLCVSGCSAHSGMISMFTCCLRFAWEESCGACWGTCECRLFWHILQLTVFDNHAELLLVMAEWFIASQLLEVEYHIMLWCFGFIKELFWWTYCPLLYWMCAGSFWLPALQRHRVPRPEAGESSSGWGRLCQNGHFTVHIPLNTMVKGPNVWGPIKQSWNFLWIAF